MAKGTRVMRDADGNIYDIPFAEVEKAMKSGLSLTTQMADEKGGIYDIPEMEVAAAQKAGLKPLASEKSPYEKEKADVANAMQKYPTASKVVRGVADVFSPVAAGVESVADYFSPGTGTKLRQERLRKEEMFDQLPGGGTSGARTAGQVGAVVVPAVIAAPAQTLRAVTAIPGAARAVGPKVGRALYAGVKKVGDYFAAATAGYFAGKAGAEADKAAQEIVK